jgi:hypothetical protein
MLADATPADLLAGAMPAPAIALTIAAADPQRAIEIISSEPGITEVAVAERINGTTRLLVRTTQQPPSASAIATLLGQAEIAADEIYLRRPTLDDVFRKITTGAEH